ncbi:MAG: EAL domain-containing protein [Pseudomonadota bacterium]|nr:EAL domain-containing protein [Pseudomonadota bacterium]
MGDERPLEAHPPLQRAARAREDALDDVAWMAAALCHAPISMLSRLDEGRQWCSTRHQVGADQVAGSEPFSAQVILGSGVFEVPDARQDARFMALAVVEGGPGVRFYAGAALLGRNGDCYGTLCVMDVEPRHLDASQREALERLARIAAANIEERLERLERLDARASAHRITSLLETMSDGVVSCGADGMLREFSGVARQWHGVDPRALAPQHWARHFGLYDCDGITPMATEHIPLFRAWQGDQVRDVEMVIKAEGQPPRMVMCNGERLTDSDGSALGAVVVMRDITRLKATAAQLAESEERLRVTLHSIGDAVLTTDTSGAVTYVNPVAEQLLAWPAARILGMPLDMVFSIVHERSGLPAPDPVARLLGGDLREPPEDVALLRPDGSRLSIQHRVAPIHNAAGDMVGTVLVFHDVTAARELASRISHQASHDELTDLANRREFEHQLEAALDPSAPLGKGHALFYIDLDQFKIVNDTCGHVAGDELLRQVARVLQSGLRDRDLLARLGGDEFGVLLRDCPLAPALRVAEKLRASLEALHFAWQDRSFSIGASIGVVPFDTGMSVTDVMSWADSACYIAKEKGRNRVYVHEAGSADVLNRSGELNWASRLHAALAENRFVLFAQEIVPLTPSTDPHRHYEVLLRLRDEEGQLVAPMTFIPAAGRYGLMPAIDRWVVDHSLSALASAKGAFAGTRLSINLSGFTLSDETFLDWVECAFARHGVRFEQVCFEITETVAIANLPQAEAFIARFKQHGCRFSLDDFGSGMSSFGYLKRLRVDYLKIDGGFVQNLLNDNVDEAMVSAIHSVAHVMGLRTVAEFVETDATQRRLEQLGIDFAQGYGVHRPQALIELL